MGTGTPYHHSCLTSSHILPPSDVECYEPLQRIYENEFLKIMRQNSLVITRYNIRESIPESIIPRKPSVRI